MENKTIEILLNHRTIRKWKDEKVSKDIIDLLLKVANRTSTSNGLQMASIIRITDTEIRQKISEISKQNYINEAPEFWVFIADNHRTNRIMQEDGFEKSAANDADKFIQAFTDAAIMGQNVATAAESLGLGFTIFGSILNDAEKLIEILELPKYTFPVIGLGFGYPDQDPKIKPRMEISKRVFENKYEVFENYHKELEDYDKEMQTYYDLRDTSRPLESFTKQVIGKNEKPNLNRRYLIKVAKEQGYDIEI